MATAELVPPQKPTLRISDFYRPWPKQTIWHSLSFDHHPVKHRLAVGSFGSGKSRPLLMEAVMHCMEFPGSRSLMLRKTMPDLKRTVIDKFESDIPKSLYERGSQERGTFNKSEHFVYWPPVLCEDIDPVTGAKILDSTGHVKKVWRQSILQFGACERVADVGKYLSTDYLFIGFEELGEFPFLIYDALEGRNRCTLWGTYPCMGGATNPMGIGWGWIKRLWVDHKPAHGMDPEKYNPADYQFVHSTVDDNPILIRDKKYVESLEKSPLRAKIRWGDLETVSGTYFENFEEKRHVLPRSAFIFESWQPVWAGWDYGFGHFAVITFWTKAWLKPRFEGEKKRMVNVTIKEIVMNGPGALPMPGDEETDPKEAIILKKTAEEQAQALIMAIPRLRDEDGIEQGYAWDISAIHFSWERFIPHTKNKEGDEVSVALQVGDILAAAGLPRPTRSSTDRVAGFTRMYSLLDTDEWFLLDECKNCAEALPLLVRGDGVTTNLEDVVKPKGASLADDCGDSCLGAGTMIDTARGLVPIESVTTSDFVLTRDGFQRVLWAGQTGIKSVRKFHTLFVTPNHPIFIGEEFVINSDTPSCPRLFIKKRSFLKASSIAATQTASIATYGTTSADGKTDAIRSYTSKFTAVLTDRFRKGITSTMWTRILSIIKRIILSRSQSEDISNTIPSHALCGESAPLAESHFSPEEIGATRTVYTVPRGANASQRNVDTAAKNSPEGSVLVAQDSAQMPVRPLGDERLNLTMWQRIANYATRFSRRIGILTFGFARVRVAVSSMQMLEPRPVFNLSVEKTEEYFANGILVHNCRYAVAGALLDPEDKPKEQKRREELDRIKDPMTKFIRGYKHYNEDQAAQRQAQGGGKIVPSWQRGFRK